MKLWILMLGGLLPFLAIAQTNTIEKIGAADAKDYVGKSVVVTGRVAEVHITAKVVQLNFDRPFPNQPFTAVVFSNRTNLFSDLSELKSKAVEVSGTIAEYRSRPEIIINRTNQLKVLPGEKK